MIEEIREVLDGYPNTLLLHQTPNRELPVCAAIERIANQAKELFKNETSFGIQEYVLGRSITQRNERKKKPELGAKK